MGCEGGLAAGGAAGIAFVDAGAADAGAVGTGATAGAGTGVTALVWAGRPGRPLAGTGLAGGVLVEAEWPAGASS